MAGANDTLDQLTQTLLAARGEASKLGGLSRPTVGLYDYQKAVEDATNILYRQQSDEEARRGREAEQATQLQERLVRTKGAEERQAEAESQAAKGKREIALTREQQPELRDLIEKGDYAGVRQYHIQKLLADKPTAKIAYDLIQRGDTPGAMKFLDDLTGKDAKIMGDIEMAKLKAFTALSGQQATERAAYKKALSDIVAHIGQFAPEVGTLLAPLLSQLEAGPGQSKPNTLDILQPKPQGASPPSNLFIGGKYLPPPLAAGATGIDTILRYLAARGQ